MSVTWLPVNFTRLRPTKYDIAIVETEIAYASYTPLKEDNGEWMGALFATKDIRPGVSIGQYTGRRYRKKEAERVSNQHYMFNARVSGNNKRTVVIDGNPLLYPFNLVGYANYAKGRSANAKFVDDASNAPAGETGVYLISKEHIPKGVEIRVDYDGDVGMDKPFFKQMIQSGTSAHDLKSTIYKTVRWSYPLSRRGAVVRTTPELGRQNLNANIIKRPRGRPPLNTRWDTHRGMYVNTL